MNSDGGSFAYDDILLIPRKSSIESRDQVDIGVQIGYTKLRCPVLSSPMDTVTTAPMAAAVSRAGGLGVLHRYNKPEEQVSMASEARAMGAENIAAAIGATGDFLHRARLLKKEGVTNFCIDVAHGHHTSVERALKKLRDSFGEDVNIIAGNIATQEGYVDLANWGADVVRVGIGGGSICSTRTQTGHGLPTLFSVALCSAARKFNNLSSLILADGGIRSSGDIVKSLAFGADLVMVGSMLAGTPEAPGEVIELNSGEMRKVYRGMASREAQMDWKGSARSLEGISSSVRLKPPAYDILTDVSFNIKSGLSYSGARSISEFQKVVKYVFQSPASQVESSTHILHRGVS